MNAISSTYGLLTLVREAKTVSEGVALVKQIDALKVALESVDRFHEEAVRYAQLEAEALIRVVELGGLNKLRAPHKRTAEWLSTLSAEDRAHFIRKCQTGLTIDQVFSMEVLSGEKLERALLSARTQEDCAIHDLKQDGIVDFAYYADSVRKAMGPDRTTLAHDIVNGMRGRLRDLGAVGLGHDEGIYVLPGRKDGNNDEIKAAIMTRYESIASDLKNIGKIAKVSGVRMSFREFEDDIYHADRSADGPLIHVLIALDRMGVLSDGGEMYKEIERSELYAEIKYVVQETGMTREQALELISRQGGTER